MNKRGSGQRVQIYFFLAASSSSFWKPIIAFERTDRTKGTVTNLCCTNLARTLEPCLSPIVAKRLVSIEFSLLLGNLTRLFMNRGGREGEGLTGSTGF